MNSPIFTSKIYHWQVKPYSEQKQKSKNFNIIPVFCENIHICNLKFQHLYRRLKYYELMYKLSLIPVPLLGNYSFIIFKMVPSAIARFFTLDDGMFAFNLKFLVLFGLWPENYFTDTQRFLYKMYDIVLHLCSFIFFIITTIGTYQNKNNVIMLLSNLDKTMVAYNFYFKSVFFILKRDRLRKLIEEIELSGDVITEERKRFMAKGLLIITGLSVVIVSAFSALAVFEGVMSAEAWMPFDPLKNRINLIMSVQALAIVFLPGLFRGYAIQGMVCSLIMYVCDQLVELQKMIRELKFSKEIEMETRKKFRDIIKKHVRLMEYSIEMDYIFKEYFAIQHLAITVELCLTAVMVAIVSDSTLTSFMAYLTVALLNAYIYCYLGNEMIILSQGIAMAAYESSWISWPLDMQKDLLIMIRAAQRPMALSAGGVVYMSLQTFSQALYNGYSIYAVLNDMVD